MGLTATAHIERYSPRADEAEAGMEPGFSIVTTWASEHLAIDRPHGHGFIISAGKRALAERLVAAIGAGVVFKAPEIKRDVNGATYVSSASQVLGRTLNADLKRLGF